MKFVLALIVILSTGGLSFAQWKSQEKGLEDLKSVLQSKGLHNLMMAYQSLPDEFERLSQAGAKVTVKKKSLSACNNFLSHANTVFSRPSTGVGNHLYYHAVEKIGEAGNQCQAQLDEVDSEQNTIAEMAKEEIRKREVAKSLNSENSQLLLRMASFEKRMKALPDDLRPQVNSSSCRAALNSSEFLSMTDLAQKRAKLEEFSISDNECETVLTKAEALASARADKSRLVSVASATLRKYESAAGSLRTLPESQELSSIASDIESDCSAITQYQAAPALAEIILTDASINSCNEIVDKHAERINVAIESQRQAALLRREAEQAELAKQARIYAQKAENDTSLIGGLAAAHSVCALYYENSSYEKLATRHAHFMSVAVRANHVTDKSTTYTAKKEALNKFLAGYISAKLNTAEKVDVDDFVSAITGRYETCQEVLKFAER